MSGLPHVGPGAAWRVIRSRNFGPYFAGNAASASGTWFQNLAGSILVFRLTHSAFMLGVLAFCQFAPVLLLAPWAGSWADRFDRRKLILGSQLAAIAFSGGLAALLTVYAGFDPLTAYLATSPGGMDSIAIIAVSGHVDTPFVMTLQTVRFVLVLLTGPRLANFLAAKTEAVAQPQDVV